MPSKLYVGNLAYSVSDADLEQLFSQAGEVQSATVITVNDTELKGRNIKVDEARPRESSFGGGNRGGGRPSGNRGRNRW
jgi:RNA recognition motif-containing protein